MALIIVPIRYEIRGGMLLIHSGIRKIRVPADGITRIHPNRSPVGSPALSMDRLAVEYRASRISRPVVDISPVRREAFMRELAVAAGLERRGDELVRPHILSQPIEEAE